jgi:TolA-binding protein
MILRQIAFVLLLTSALIAQSPASPERPLSAQAAEGPSASPQSAAPQARQGSSQANDALAQMQDDLNKLESLNLNMSSEIEFLRDQNLQILLRTNSQMWNVLIRDLHRQIEREQQLRGTRPQTTDHGSAPKPDR